MATIISENKGGVMRRISNLWPQILAFDNLLASAKKASKGKRQLASVASFLERLEPECLSLQRNFIDQTYQPGKPIEFKIFDPKERTISAAPFRDRVVHHAIMGPLEPVFERRMIFESFACRKNKGTHSALNHAHKQIRRYKHFLKMDIRKFFNSIDHQVIYETVKRVIKDGKTLGLLKTIIQSNGKHQVGLPIGNLTSQWLANLLLDRLDHFVKEKLRIPGYVRYMDDFVLFSNDKQQLKEAHKKVSEFLQETLLLKLKASATILGAAHHGLPFLGWRLSPGLRRLRPENLRRTQQRLKQRRWEYKIGIITEGKLADIERSMFEHLKSGNTYRLRLKLIE
jgi:RNA-directed DNA polymerase